jgi:hypothetical protein
MARYSFITLIVLLSCAFTFGQFNIPEINKLKDVKLLESNNFDVQRLLFDFKSDGWDATEHEQHFDTENYSIDIYYSSGDCSEDNEIWKATEWKVTRIEIERNEPLKVKDLGFDFQKFKKEQRSVEESKHFIYSDKEKGIAFDVDEENGEVENIILLPSKTSNTQRCDTDEAKEYFDYESWFGNKQLKDRHLSGDIDVPPNITELTLSENEIPLLRFDKRIQVSAVAVDPEYDVLTYNYIVSGGRIIGSGPKVLWDLQGLATGTYTITAGVDDGCGVCGKTMTKTVNIR